MPLALFALAVCAFGIGTTEFVINGLQSEIVAELDVSVPAAGLLVAGFAAGIIIGAPLTAALGVRRRHKTLLLLTMALFTVSNLVVAMAAGYETLMAGRVLGGVSVGGFYGIGSVVAAELVRPTHRARAIALMFTGATVGTTLGVPAGAFVGQVLSWRVTFGVLAGLGLVSLTALTLLVPDAGSAARPGLRAELTAFARKPVLVALLMTACVFGAITTTYAYIEPLLTTVTGYSPGGVALLLLVAGAGLCAGNVIGGAVADRSALATLVVGFAVFTMVLAAVAVGAHSRVAMPVLVFLFGAAGYALVPGAQVRVLAEAGDAPTLASAVNISAFNAGVVAGSWLGGTTIDAGLGYTSVAWAGAAIAAVGFVLAAATAVHERIRTRRLPSLPQRPAQPTRATTTRTSAEVKGCGDARA
jgi:MFS transporter, DHA1 family, inner membrane transport protein